MFFSECPSCEGVISALINSIKHKYNAGCGRNANGKKLQLTYEEFMRTMGSGAIAFMTGESVCMNEVYWKI